MKIREKKDINSKTESTQHGMQINFLSRICDNKSRKNGMKELQRGKNNTFILSNSSDEECDYKRPLLFISRVKMNFS